MQAQIRKAVNQMMKQLTTTSNQPAPIKSIPLDTFDHLFNDEAREVFKTKAYGLIHQYNTINDERAHMYNLFELASLLDVRSALHNPCINFYTHNFVKVKFFGLTCQPHEVIPCIYKVIEAINNMASNKWLQASLYNLGMMELRDVDGKQSFAIFSYLAPKAEHEIDVEQAYSHIEFQEGGVPPEFK